MIGLLVAAVLLQGGTPTRGFRSIDRGTQSFVDTPLQATARTASEWDALWKRHAPGRPQPPVDFGREMVVGVFGGSRNSAGYGIDLVSAEEQQGTLVVRYRETAPARGRVTAQIITTPYHLAAVPKHDGTVRFEKIE